ncbi:MAG TPA: peptidyl-prolyl cis-trans isomerase [Blastocatellia bacterium]|nr:peptidyl-prolyl cis-trans isomerase [Blastocatellia bacterium]
MLKFLSGRKRSRNLLLVFFVLVMTLSLVGLFSVAVSGGAAGLFGNKNGGSDTTIAKVGSYEVTLKEYKDALTGFSRQISQGQGRTGMQSLTTTYAQYGQQILDNLLREKLVQYEADRLNLSATDEEVEARLKQTFSPWPGPEQYRERLIQAGMTPAQFEAGLRASLSAEHLRSYITAAVQLSPQEVEDEYRRNNNRYSIRWADVSPDQLKDKVTFTDSDLRAFFDSHKDDFKITTEQRRARYIFVDSAKAGEAVQVSDDELKPDFDPERNLKAVRVSQIVLNVPKVEKPDPNKPASAQQTGDPEETVRKKAQELTDRAKAGEDFAKLARENSNDAASRAGGGDIGWVNKDAKRESDDPLNNAFNFKAGDVSQPIKKGDKYYILKVIERRMATFEEAKPGLLKEARMRKGYSEAVNIANQALQRLKETKDAQAVVTEINKQRGVEVAALRETPFFSRGDNLPELNGAFELQAAVFQLQNPGDVGESVNVQGGFAIPQYVEKRDPHDPTFEEVRAKVEQRYREDRAKQLAQDRARQIGQAKSPDEMKKIADSLGVKVDERPGIGESDSIGPLTTDESRAAIYKLNVGQVTAEPMKSDSDHYVVAAVVGRKDADMGEAFQKEKKSLEQRMLDEKRNVYFSTYLAELQQRLKTDGKIKVYQNRLDDAMEALATQPGAAPQPDMPPAMPQRPRRQPARLPGQ